MIYLTHPSPRLATRFSTANRTIRKGALAAGGNR
jgi:hypothetical protein